MAILPAINIVSAKFSGSLTLGGYGASFVELNDLTFEFTPDNNFDLAINVNGISMTSSDGKKNLSSASFPAFVDSTVPYLYSPVEFARNSKMLSALRTITRMVSTLSIPHYTPSTWNKQLMLYSRQQMRLATLSLILSFYTRLSI
jgi:hypothetical protein